LERIVAIRETKLIIPLEMRRKSKGKMKMKYLQAERIAGRFGLIRIKITRGRKI